MEELFQALKERYPGCEVVDVRFTVKPEKLGGFTQDIAEIDRGFAQAIRTAREIPLEELAAMCGRSDHMLHAEQTAGPAAG